MYLLCLLVESSGLVRFMQFDGLVCSRFGWSKQYAFVWFQIFPKMELKFVWVHFDCHHYCTLASRTHTRVIMLLCNQKTLCRIVCYCSRCSSSRLQPNQPIVQDPSMPPLAPPDPATQLEEARRRLQQPTTTSAPPKSLLVCCVVFTAVVRSFLTV